MDPRKLFDEYGLDERLNDNFCIYCGLEADTTDHAPSRILLDDPLPLNLSRVPACRMCNTSFSAHEEYLACFLDCVLSGTATPEKLSRSKIRKALTHTPALAARIQAALSDDGDQKVWTPEMTRVKEVIVKIARGHAFHELATTFQESPEIVNIRPLCSMDAADRLRFERDEQVDVWPEIGSRAFVRAIDGWRGSNSDGRWTCVQSNRYRYVVQADGSVSMVLSEYLACQVAWDRSGAQARDNTHTCSDLP